MVKKLLKSLREYKKNTLLGPLLMMGEVLMDVLIPFLMARLIDFGVEPGDTGYILKMGLLLLLAAIISMIFGISSSNQTSTAATGLSKNLRHDLYYAVQDFSFKNIDKFSTASIVTRLTTDITSIQMAFMMVVRAAVRAPLMIIFSVIMVMSINIRLALIFLCVIPILGIALFVLVKYTHPIFRKVFSSYDKLNNVVQENLNGIRVVKSFVREEHEKEKFNNVSGEIYHYFTKAERMISFNMPLMQLCVYTCMILVSWVGAHFIVSNTMTTGDLMSVMTYIMQILMSLMMLSMVFVMITMSQAAVRRAVEMLDEVSDIQDCDEPVYDVPDGTIEFKNVNFSYSGKKEKYVLSNINLSIASGETIGIIGETGSAKSTLVQLIPRLYDVTEGEITVGGVDIRNYDIETLRNSVAMVLQKNVLFSGTIKDNLRWGNENATDEELEHACKLACADEFIKEMPDGYDTYIEQGGTNVSGGQKQRLCIARALLKKPAILILDDSTSAVDTNTDARIRQAFRDEIPNTTKLIIAQRIASVQDSDKIVMLHGGQIAAFGTHDELMQANDMYREIYHSQMKGGLSDGASA